MRFLNGHIAVRDKAQVFFAISAKHFQLNRIVGH